ncbi:hypothetical protein [Kocuria arenosa]|uniref:hypothetical protein n=1 Tax=Kocuria arenosa TaxID=3071446 RepID=UPI0034D3B373
MTSETSARAEAMIGARRGTSTAKQQALMSQIQRMRIRAEVEPIVSLCRRAEVSTAFFYRRGFKAPYLEAVAEISGASWERTVAQAEASGASLRAENANLKQTVSRQKRQITVLEGKLASAMGEAYTASPAVQAAAQTDVELRRRISRLEDELADAQRIAEELLTTNEALRESNLIYQRDNTHLLNREP